MNKDQTAGKVKEIVGKAQAGAGKLAGNSQQEFKGHRLVVEGKAREILSNAKGFMKDSSQSTKDTLPTLR